MAFGALSAAALLGLAGFPAALAQSSAGDDPNGTARPAAAPTPPAASSIARDAALELARAALREFSPEKLGLRPLAAADALTTSPLRVDGRVFAPEELKSAFPDFLRAARPDSAASTETLALFRTDFLLRELVAERARREGFDQQEEIRRLVQRRANEALTEQYVRRAVLGDLSVSASEVEKYYEARPEEFSTPRMATMRIVVVGSEAEAAEAERQLKQGVPFEKVAEALSIHASRQRGGLLKPMPRGSLDPKVEAEAWRLKPGEFTPSIPVNDLFYLVNLVEISPARVEPLEAVRPQLLEKLYESKRRERLGAFAAELLADREVSLFGDPPAPPPPPAPAPSAPEPAPDAAN